MTTTTFSSRTLFGRVPAPLYASGSCSDFAATCAPADAVATARPFATTSEATTTTATATTATIHTAHMANSWLGDDVEVEGLGSGDATKRNTPGRLEGVT